MRAPTRVSTFRLVVERERERERAMSEGYVNVMNGAGFVALAGAMATASTQGDGYESKGMSLGSVAGINLDMNVWLPMLIAIPLIMLGHIAATSKMSPDKQANSTKKPSSSKKKTSSAKKKASGSSAKKKASGSSAKKTPKKKARAKSKTPKRSAKKTPKKSSSNEPSTSVRKSGRRRKAPTIYDASMPTTVTFMS